MLVIDGEMLGFGGEQSHQALSRPSLRCLLPLAPPDARRARHGGQGRLGACLGYADEGAGACSRGTYGDGRGCEVSGVGPAGYYGQYGLDCSVCFFLHPFLLPSPLASITHDVRTASGTSLPEKPWSHSRTTKSLCALWPSTRQNTRSPLGPRGETISRSGSVRRGRLCLILVGIMRLLIR